MNSTDRAALEHDFRNALAASVPDPATREEILRLLLHCVGVVDEEWLKLLTQFQEQFEAGAADGGPSAPGLRVAARAIGGFIALEQAP